MGSPSGGSGSSIESNCPGALGGRARAERRRKKREEEKSDDRPFFPFFSCSLEILRSFRVPSHERSARDSCTVVVMDGIKKEEEKGEGELDSCVTLLHLLQKSFHLAVQGTYYYMHMLSNPHVLEHHLRWEMRGSSPSPPLPTYGADVKHLPLG